MTHVSPAGWWLRASAPPKSRTGQRELSSLLPLAPLLVLSPPLLPLALLPALSPPALLPLPAAALPSGCSCPVRVTVGPAATMGSQGAYGDQSSGRRVTSAAGGGAARRGAARGRPGRESSGGLPFYCPPHDPVQPPWAVPRLPVAKTWGGLKASAPPVGPHRPHQPGSCATPCTCEDDGGRCGVEAGHELRPRRC